MNKYIFWSIAFIIFISAPFIGVATIDLHSIFIPDTISNRIFFDIRLPRTLLAFFVGGSLSLAGLVFQTVFRNILMTPFTLGVSGGAVLGAAVAIKLGLDIIFGIYAVSLFGFAGAFFTIIVLIILSRYLLRARQESLLLLGIALSFFYSSALMVIFYLSSFTQTATIMRFTMGSLSIIGYDNVALVASASILLVVLIWLKRFELQLLALSQEQATTKGIDTEKLSYFLLLITSIIIGLIVSITGPIGFIGLIVPHMIRQLYKKSIPHLIVPTFLLGGFFLLGCDSIAKAISTSSEIPIGIITALIGGPFFIFLIISKHK